MQSVAPKPLPPLIISSDSGQPASSGEHPALALSLSVRAAEVPVEVKRKGPRSSWPPTHGGGEPEVHWADLEEMERHHRADLEEMKNIIIHLVEETILAMETKERLLKLGITLQGAMKPSQIGYEPGHHDHGYAYRKPNQNSSPSDPTRCSKERAQKFEYESIRTKSDHQFGVASSVTWPWGAGETCPQSDCTCPSKKW
eukprot:g74978.t1